MSASDLTTGELELVAARMRAAGLDLDGPLQARILTAGRSNLTFVLDDGRDRWVMRMPPRVGRTPSAHDVAREYRVTAALAGTGVPVPRTVVLEEDESLLGGAFAIAEFVRGASLQTRDDLDAVEDAALADIVEDLAGTLAALHRVDHVAAGLERFGRPDEYAARQLRRWSSQWDLVGAPELKAEGAEVAAALTARVPEQLSTGIVHGDYRIDNTLIDLAARRVLAVVDWELSTIGDPVADVAMMCAYRHPALDLILGQPSAWTSDRLPDPTALAEAYERAGGVPLAHWSFHMALAYFKIGVIAAGIDHRRQAGATSGAGHDTAGESVATYLDLARSALNG